MNTEFKKAIITIRNIITFFIVVGFLSFFLIISISRGLVLALDTVVGINLYSHWWWALILMIVIAPMSAGIAYWVAKGYAVTMRRYAPEFLNKEIADLK